VTTSFRRHHDIVVDINGLAHLFVGRQLVATFLAPFDVAIYCGCFAWRELAVEPGD
jgi:hypothetical protein